MSTPDNDKVKRLIFDFLVIYTNVLDNKYRVFYSDVPAGKGRCAEEVIDFIRGHPYLTNELFNSLSDTSTGLDVS